MQKPLVVAISFICASLFFWSTLECVSYAQVQPTVAADTTRGIELYNRGNIDDALKTLSKAVRQNSSDGNAWYYFGLALNRKESSWIEQGSSSKVWTSREAFERAAYLLPNFAPAHRELAYTLLLANEARRASAEAERALELGEKSAQSNYIIGEVNLRAKEYDKALASAETALQLEPDFPPALLLKSQALSNTKRFTEAAVSLERFLAVSPGDPDAEAWREQLDTLRQRSNAITTEAPSKQDKVFSSKETARKFRILYKPEANYTEAARKAGVSGMVSLLAVMSSDGLVKQVFILQSLSHGLTKTAVEAIHKIKFEPATIDNHNVSVYVRIEYQFNLY